ncbi:hypothetical protein HW115_16575 [Verrucomicrobiaceae bacterium N1E253]|uniref:Carbohydrate-binding family V/XII n=1 Tax=Oceaniferula marina TaxID=2748318 RepID=A0A851GJ86_9BACT|nr:hypothetical protein [Oceaniferula marina]NWK57239.1 hypothetical protein [Oceaniferula marina]
MKHIIYPTSAFVASVLATTYPSMAQAEPQQNGGSIVNTQVNLDPPPIFYSDTPSVIVSFMGEPVMEPVKSGDNSLMFAVNTNWDVLFDTSSGGYFLLVGDHWLKTQDLLKGAWVPARELPQSFSQLPNDENWSEVKIRLNTTKGPSEAPNVFVSDQPAELIQTEGQPHMSPIPGTGLLYVSNTEDDLFFLPSEKSYYYLTAGRWFRATALTGPWTAATLDLPDDFAKIRSDHVKGSVLVSVPGTSQAEEAVLLASTPQKATVSRDSVTLEVVYDGEPQFEPVVGSDNLMFAVNTSYDVFEVSGQYYACHQGVWFQAALPTGEWMVCDNVPTAIYSIPEESPKYNVTHVKVYESTPETVVVGATGGYSGAYVARGLVVFGLGYWLGHEDGHDHHYHHHHPKPCWYGYGGGSHYHHGSGYVARGGYRYGPHGGVGAVAAYNPHTGGYARGAYAYGPRGVAAGKSAYNPWTNTAAGRVGAATPYGSWGRSAVVRDGEWARTGHRSNANATARAIQTSKGGEAIRVNRKYGSDKFLGKNKDGDVFVGKDGNLYRRDDGGWQKRSDGGWHGAPGIHPPSQTVHRTGQHHAQRTTQSVSRRTSTTVQPKSTRIQQTPPSVSSRQTVTRRKTTTAQPSYQGSVNRYSKSTQVNRQQRQYSSSTRKSSSRSYKQSSGRTSYSKSTRSRSSGGRGRRR